MLFVCFISSVEAYRCLFIYVIFPNFREPTSFPAKVFICFLFIPIGDNLAKWVGGPLLGSATWRIFLFEFFDHSCFHPFLQKLDKRAILTLLPPAIEFSGSFEQVTR